MARVLGAWRDGWRRVFDAPAIVLGVFLLTVVLALPLTLAVHGLIESHLASSMLAAEVADGVSYDWWNEFLAQTVGLGRTLTPSIIGFASTLDTLSGILDARGVVVPVGGVLALYLVCWTFMLGGVLDRYARQRPTRAHGFFAASGVHVWRLLRVAAAAGLAYWWLFAYVHDWLFDRLYVNLTRDIPVERVVFAWRAAGYALFGLLLVVVNIVADYAKVRIVVEDRRSALGALAASLRFIGRVPAHTFGLYALNGASFAAAIALWAVLAPGVTGSGAGMWLAFLAGQAYILARLLLKLQFLASQTALFQSHLAHATYTAAPERAWPDSPVIERLAPAAVAKAATDRGGGA